MQTRQSAKMEFFKHPSDLNTPAEYGTKNKPEGWVKVTVPELNQQTLYLASEYYAVHLAKRHRIPPACVVSLIAPSPLAKHGIPEEYLEGPKGLACFNDRVGKISHQQTRVIIHCKHGLNRTPVAAVIYLVNQGLSPKRAVELVSTAYDEQREPGFVLNKRGFYTAVLAEIGIETSRLRHTRK